MRTSLPSPYKIKEAVINLNLCHSSDPLGFKHFLNILLIVISGEKISNVVFTGGYSEQDWLELKNTDMEEKFSQTVLKLRICGILVNNCLNYNFIVTIYSNAVSSPAVPPQPDSQYSTPELF